MIAVRDLREGKTLIESRHLGNSSTKEIESGKINSQSGKLKFIRIQDNSIFATEDEIIDGSRPIMF